MSPAPQISLQNGLAHFFARPPAALSLITSPLLEALEDLEDLENLEVLEALEALEALENLENLEALESKKRP